MTLDLRALEEAGKQLEEERIKYQDLLERRGQIFFEQKECEIVLEEFEFLNETDVVMKKNGPILAKQDLGEAKTEVQNTLSIIKEQLQKVEKALDDQEKAVQAAEKKLQAFQAQVK